MSKIQEWVYNLLVRIGLISENSSYLDNIVILLLIIAVTVGIDYSCRYIFLGMFKRLARKTKNQLDDLIVDRKIINKMMHIIPAILIYILLPFAFSAEETPKILILLQKLCQIYIIAVSLLAGLGASAAILMLVFKDTILGFVAGIQLSANDMLRAGDWITMSKYGADGTVIEVTLNAVKVRNFDNTITTIPPYALVSDAFQNWRGMSESPGRRIKRSINIDMNSVHFCTPEMLEKFRKISLITDYIDGKEQELDEYNEEHHIDSSIWVNGRRQTNLGVFRAYLVRYLRSLPEVSKELVCMVRHLQPTDTGIPIELYCFSSNKVWVEYEGIQADIFDHVLAVIPEFGLSVFQNVSGADLKNIIIKLPAGSQPSECF